MPKHGIFEILNMINDLPEYEARKYSLSTCQDNIVLMQILQCTFSPHIKFMLPPGPPPYKPNDAAAGQEMILYREWRRIYLFLEGQGPDMPPLKRETLFIQMLETVCAKDAEILVYMKDKTCPYKNITAELVYDTFPFLIPDPAEFPVSPARIEEQQKPKRENRPELERACPFGCTTKAGKTFMMPGPLMKHLKDAHSFNEEQIAEFKKEHYN